MCDELASKALEMFKQKVDAKIDSNYLYFFANRLQILADPQKYVDMQLMGWEFDFPLRHENFGDDIITLKITKAMYCAIRSSSPTTESN